MGRVRKGRKSSNLLFRYSRSEPSHIEFCSELFFIEIPQLSIITELSMPRTFFCICSFLTANNSKDFKKRKRSEGCDSLLPVGNLCFSAFFCQNHTPSLIFEGKTSICEVSKIFGCCGFLCLQNISSYLIHTWKVSREISLGSVLVLLASYSRADWQQVFTCQRFAIFFAASKKPDGSWQRSLHRVVG